MAQTVTLTPQDYTSILAMLNHEGANGISALLKSGNTADALGYTGGLIDVWTNRAAASGRAPWQEMNRPSQITDWDPSQIQAKANSLDPRIKELADAYLSQRANGGQAIAPGAGFYLNTQLVKATPSYGTKYQDWYGPGTVEAAFGDTRSGGRNSLQTEFVSNPDEYDVPQYSLALDRSLNLAPTSNGTSAYNQLMYRSNPISSDPNHVFNAGFGGYLNADPTASIGGAPAQTSTAQGPNFGSLYGIQPNPVISPTDFLKGYDVSGDAGAQTFSSLYGPDQVINAAYRNYLGRNATAEEKGAWDDKIGQPGTVLSNLVGQIAGSPEANAVRAQMNLGPYAFSGAQIGTTGGAGSVQPAQPTDTGLNLNPIQQPNLDTTVTGPQQATDLGTLLGSTDFGKNTNVGTNYGASGIQPPQPVDTNLNLGPIQSGNVDTRINQPGSLGALLLGTDFGGNVSQGVQPGSFKDFDPNWYLSHNADVAQVAQQQGLDPSKYALQHYLTYGFNEGRDFAQGERLNQNFDAQAYLTKNTDVGSVAQQQGLNPLQFALQHFVTNGVGEGRTADAGATPYSYGATASPGTSFGANPFGHFDASEYLRLNPDVAGVAQQQGLDPSSFALQHALTYGEREGRQFGQGQYLDPNFDAKEYLRENPDVAAAGANPLLHFLEYGAAEGRQAPTGANPFAFTSADVSGGLSGLPTDILPAVQQFAQANLGSAPTIDALPTVNPGTGPLAFGNTNVSSGVSNGSVSDFNPSWYLQNNPDVAKSGMDPLSHYLTYGYNEGRAIAPNEWLTGGFDANGYYQANPDVKAAGVDALTHYLTHGLEEGRSTGSDVSPFSFSQANVSGGVGNGAMGLPDGYVATGAGNSTSPSYGYSGPILSPADVQARSAATQQYNQTAANLANYTAASGQRSALDAQKAAGINTNPNYVGPASPNLIVASDGAGQSLNNLSIQQYQQALKTAEMSQAQPAVKPLGPVIGYGQQLAASFPTYNLGWMG